MGSGFRTFQSGEVLTSSNVQNYLMDQAVTVFAGTAARGSAIASPETGMVSYRTDGTADSKREGFEFYDGASWTRLIPATSIAGLELVSSTTIGSAVSSVTVSDAFSSTYDNYRIIINGGVGSTTSYLKLTLGATATGYYYAGFYTGASWTAALNADAAANATFWYAAGVTTTNSGAIIDVLAPNLAKATAYNTWYPDFRTTGSASWYAGYLNDSTQYTAFTLTVNSGTITGGTIKVYGYKN